MQTNTFSQSKEFVAGTMLGFYGVHINGEIEEMYSSSSGKIWGTGGFSAGFNLKRSFSKKSYGLFELRYTRKGSLFEFITNYGMQGYETIKLDYIELPLLFGLNLNLINKTLLFETGFSFGRLVKSKFSVNKAHSWDTTEKLNNFKKNTLSWVVNVKYPIVRSKQLLLGLRFTNSLFSIHTDYKLYNMIYGIELYYLFKKES